MNLAPYLVVPDPTAPFWPFGGPRAALLPNRERIAEFRRRHADLFVPHMLDQYPLQDLPTGLYVLSGKTARALDQEQNESVASAEILPEQFVAAVPFAPTRYLLFPEVTNRDVFSFFRPVFQAEERAAVLRTVTYELNDSESDWKEIPSESDAGCALAIRHQDDLFACLDRGCKKKGKKCRLRKAFKGRAVILRCVCEGIQSPS
jgi:hypothetical protein